MSQPVSPVPHTAQVSTSQRTRLYTSTLREVVQGIGTGLIPLLLLAILVVATIFVTAFVRQSASGSGFFVWERDALITLIMGMVLALIVYIVALLLVLRTTTRWVQGRLTIRSAAALWTLACTALIVLLPVIIAVLLPQSPAP